MATLLKRFGFTDRDESQPAPEVVKAAGKNEIKAIAESLIKRTSETLDYLAKR